MVAVDTQTVPRETFLNAPHAVEAEQSILGSLLLDNNAIDRVAWLSEADFYRSDHRLIYSAIRAILEAGKPCDTLLLTEALQARGCLEQVGGAAYITALSVNTPSSANILHYATLVHKRAQARALQALAADMMDETRTLSHDPVKLAEVVADRALAILDERGHSEIKHISDAVGDAVDWLDAPVKGISTGYSSLDRVIEGLRPADLIVIAGRPAMGKSSLALNIAEHVGQTKPVALFSLEMSARQIGVRSLRWHEHLTDRAAAVMHLFSHRIWLDESARLTLGMMRVRLQRIRRKHGLSLVVVDYLQLMTGEGDNREQEVASLSRGLKAFAKEFNVPVIVCVQLNRNVESRQDKRPMLADLRESGAVEQDADIVLMIYNDAYYNADSEHKGFSEILIRKHREGPTGRAWLKFEPEYARFIDFTGAPPSLKQRPPIPTSGVVRMPYSES